MSAVGITGMLLRSRWYWAVLLSPPAVQAVFYTVPGGLTLQQCQSTELSWTEESPIHLWAANHTYTQPGESDVLHDFGTISLQFEPWTVNLPVGQTVVFTYEQTQSPGLLIDSETYTVASGPNTACLGPNATTSLSVSPPTRTSVPPVPDTSKYMGLPPLTKLWLVIGGLFGALALLIAATLFLNHRAKRERTVPRPPEEIEMAGALLAQPELRYDDDAAGRAEGEGEEDEMRARLSELRKSYDGGTGAQPSPWVPEAAPPAYQGYRRHQS
ncbi:hypothetical protein AcW2_000376 [Taiwanofungus camphoratus]|nr:hypothetical protein AcW2_000376 [Antrodia cinnamomea]